MEISAQARLRRIASRQNATLKTVRRAFSQAELTEDGFCSIEGLKTVEEAIRSGLRFKLVLFSETGAPRLAERVLSQVKGNVEALLVDDRTFAGVISTEAPQGVAALVKVPAHSLTQILERSDPPLLVLAAGVQDPGNLGTILRSAEAFAAAGVVLLEKTVSQFSAKTVRASAGSLFRLPVVAMPGKDAIRELRKAGVRLFGASSHKGTFLPETRLDGPAAVVIGNEGAGLSAELLREMDELLTIPHSPGVESLNAGIAAALILYEAARQRASR